MNFAAGAAPSAGIWDAIVHDFSNITEPAAFAAFIQVLLIDLVFRRLISPSLETGA